ncbi:hypothetical protein AB837_00195 [bacterium AB1]|nr:hypothetical protein AB837_00195 [bacterium AB1]
MYNKKNLSYTLIKLSTDVEKFLNYIHRIPDPQIHFEYGKIFHCFLTNEPINNIHVHTKKSILSDDKQKVFINIHEACCSILLSIMLKNNKEYQQAITGNIEYEKSKITHFVYKKRLFFIKTIPDIYNVDNKNIIELKTTSMPHYMGSRIVENYSYDMQMYMYLLSYNFKINNITIFFSSKTEYKMQSYKISQQNLDKGRDKFIFYLQKSFDLLEQYNLIEKFSFGEIEYFYFYLHLTLML